MASSLGVQINPSAPLSATHLSLSTPVSTSLLLPSGCTHGHPSTNSLIPSECENYYNPTSLLMPSECNDGATSTALIPSECNNGQISRPRCQHPGRRLIGTRIYDSILGVSCHWCRQKTVEDHVRCCECTVAFCGGCLKNRHGEFVQIEMQDDVDWVCPKCRGGCGDGCNNCCNCGPCRRAQGLEPTGLLVHTARSHGFNNVHDYLIHRITGETPEKIAERKHGKAWCRSSELSPIKRLKLEDEHVERMKCIKPATEIGLRKRPSFNLSDNKQQDISATKDSKLHSGSVFENDRYAIMPYDRYAIFPYTVPFSANIVPPQVDLGLNAQYRSPPVQFQEMGMPYPITLVPYTPHVHIDSYRWRWQFVHVKEEAVECLRSESSREEKGFICTKILKGEQLKKQKNFPDQSMEPKDYMLRDLKKADEAHQNRRSSESLKDLDHVYQPNVVLVPPDDHQTILSMVSSDLGKCPSNDNLKALKSSAICNIQQNKTKHQIEDLNLDGNVAEEQKTPHVFKSDLTKPRGEFITGIMQHREVDQTRAPKERSDLKNSHSSLILESTVALSGTPVSHNIKVKEECEDPILLKSSAICNIQQNKTKHQIEDLNLDGNVAEEQKTPHVFKSALTKHRGEFTTGIMQYREVDQTRAPKERSDLKNTHSSLILESTVALSGTPVSHNIKVKEECEDPILLKSSAICNIQQNKTKHQIEDLNLDGNVAEEQKTPHVFKSALTKHRGEFTTGIMQHREVDQTRAPKERSDLKNTHSSLILESTVALSPVSHNIKVKEECEDPISLSHLDITTDKLFASHQLDKQFQGFVINKNNDGHSANTSKVSDAKEKKLVANLEFKRKLAAKLSEPFHIDELEILTKAVSHKQPLYRSCESTAGYAPLISREQFSCLDHHPDLASQLQSSSSPEFKLSLLRGFFFWLEHSSLQDSFKPWAEPMSLKTSPNHRFKYM